MTKSEIIAAREKLAAELAENIKQADASEAERVEQVRSEYAAYRARLRSEGGEELTRLLDAALLLLDDGPAAKTPAPAAKAAEAAPAPAAAASAGPKAGPAAGPRRLPATPAASAAPVADSVFG
jgi:hypothetical protein